MDNFALIHRLAVFLFLARFTHSLTPAKTQLSHKVIPARIASYPQDGFTVGIYYQEEESE
ncbi:MAG: hypothetical protein GY782_07760 [Gammaproteobacteria bacterium]|nr:hypothetical protein [Gammaproteobacteria bacterium]